MIDTESMLYRNANVLGVTFTTNGVVIAVRQRLTIDTHALVLPSVLATVPQILEYMPERDTPVCLLYDLTTKASLVHAKLGEAKVASSLRDPSEQPTDLVPGGRMFYADYGSQVLHTLAGLVERGVVGIDDDRVINELSRLRFKREGAKLSIAEDLPWPFAYACALAAMDVRPRLPQTKDKTGRGHDPYAFLSQKR